MSNAATVVTAEVGSGLLALPPDALEDAARIFAALAPATRRAYEGHVRRFTA